MRIALTGITGFVGQNLMPMLRILGDSYQFLTLSIDVEDAEAKYPTSEYPNVRHVHTSDFPSLIAFDPEIVLHLATVTTPRNDTDIIRPMLAANIEFGVLLLDALRQCPSIRLFVNTGSFAEYRHSDGHLDSAYLYTATKTAFRAFVDYYSSLQGFRYITAVPYSVYGGKMTVKRLFDYIRESQDSVEPIGMTAGEQVLDFIHVDDVAGFFAYVVTNIEEFISLPQNGMDFYLGTGVGTSIRQVASLMENISGRSCNIKWGDLPYRERDIMYAIAPVEKNKICGWKAQISLYEGIKRFVSVSS